MPQYTHEYLLKRLLRGHWHIPKRLSLQEDIETSGAHPLTGVWDWICLSPKKNKRPLPEVHQRASELKMIIYNHHDFLFAEEMSALTQPDCIRYLQPEWSRRERMVPLIVDYVMENPQWKISLQMHKYLDIP